MSATQKPLVRNAADREQVKTGAQHESFSNVNRLADMRTVLSTRAGRNVLWWWLSQCGLFESITVQSSEIYVKSGRRDIGLHLIDAIQKADPEAYLLMQREAAKLEETKVEPQPPSEEES